MDLNDFVRVIRSAWVCVCVCGSIQGLYVSTAAVNVNWRIFYLKFQQTLPQTTRNSHWKIFQFAHSTFILD